MSPAAKEVIFVFSPFVFALLFVLVMIAIGLTFGNRCPDTPAPGSPNVSWWEYTINGEVHQYATACFTQNGSLFCDTESGARVKVDSYAPVYWEENK